MKQKIVVEQKPFLSILAAMQPICTRRTTLTATNYIMLQIGHKELVLKCTDLEISLQSSYLGKDIAIDAPRSLLVSGKRLYDLVKELEGDITFILEDDHILLQTGQVELSLNIKDAQEFPPFPERIENLMQLDSHHLLDMLNKVAFLIPQNNANPALNGLYLEVCEKEFKMTATDGHCLSQIYSPQYILEEPKKWLIPRRAIFEIKKILESSKEAITFLGICGKQLVFSSDSFNFFTKILADQFPQYSSILNKDDFIAATVDKNHFVKTLKRSSCLLSGQFIATQFSFDTDLMNVSMKNKDVGSLYESVPLQDYLEEKMEISFYAPYLLNGLHSFSQEKLTFYLKNPTKPIIFESSSNETRLLYLVMPVSPSMAS